MRFSSEIFNIRIFTSTSPYSAMNSFICTTIGLSAAFEIVKQVAESPVGLIATTDDHFVYNKGKFDNKWNNDFSVGVGTQHHIDFLVNNKDPRLLYLFRTFSLLGRFSFRQRCMP